MAIITIEITEVQLKGLEYAAVSPSDFLENAAVNRAAHANDEIISIYTSRALDEGVQIPSTREAIILDAFARGWVKTAQQMQTEYEAEQAQVMAEAV